MTFLYLREIKGFKSDNSGTKLQLWEGPDDVSLARQMKTWIIYWAEFVIGYSEFNENFQTILERKAQERKYCIYLLKK